MLEVKQLILLKPGDEDYDKFLRHKVRKVAKTKMTQAVEVADAMHAWCEERVGAVMGMAANQFGINLRVIVIHDANLQKTMINPEVIKERDHQFTTEHCMSIPKKKFKVKRPKIIKVRYINEELETHTYKGSHEMAACLKHECDHLEGITIDQIGELAK